MPEIHFIGGEKGGVGKSVVARLVAQYFIDNGIPFRGMDTDRSNGALLRYYGDYSEPIDLTDFESADRIVQYALDEQAHVVVDLAAQSDRPLDTWLDANGVIELARELGVRLVRWHVMEDSTDSVRLLEELQDRYGDTIQYVVVKNFGRGRSFRLFDESRGRRTALAQGSPVIELPELHAGTMAKVDRLDKSFWAAVNNTEACLGCLGLMERQRAKVWMRKAYRAIEGCVPARETIPMTLPELVLQNG